MLATWVPDVLRAAGLTVVTYPGWETRSHGEIRTPMSVVWHHDASGVGDSPGIPAAMSRRWDSGDGIAAQAWVDRAGVWHIIASGVAWHAGRVLPGKPSNSTSYGVETDHTTGEDWTPAQVDSLRRGTAAILRHEGRAPDPALEFHKTICSPVGRKVDPDGLDLGTERAAVAALMSGVAPAPVAAAPVRPAPQPTDLTGTQAGSPTVKLIDLRNAHRSYVRASGVAPLQRLLGVKADGVGGPDTRNALGAAQTRVGVNRDYIFGPDTASALLAGK